MKKVIVKQEEIYLLVDVMCDMLMGDETLEETTILNSIKDKFVFKPEEPYYDHQKYREAKSEVVKSLRKLLRVIVERRLEEKIKKVNFAEDKEEASNKE